VENLFKASVPSDGRKKDRSAKAISTYGLAAGRESLVEKI
jgi:hypothetical protein